MLYSTELGHVHVNDGSVLHTLYTVPAGEGPAVVRSMTIYAGPAAEVFVYAVYPDTTTAILADVKNAGAVGEAITVLMYQPFPAGVELVAIQTGAVSQDWGCVLGGYQFATP